MARRLNYIVAIKAKAQEILFVVIS